MPTPLEEDRYICVRGFDTDLTGRPYGDPKRKETRFEINQEVPASAVRKLGLLGKGLVRKLGDEVIG